MLQLGNGIGSKEEKAVSLKKATGPLNTEI